MTELLFSYGTLQLEAVQQSTFKRKLEGQRDSIIGYSISKIEITDPEVVKTSGQKYHPTVRFTGNTDDEVEGMVFKITMDELIQADGYETSDYKRVRVPLKSGGDTWVYIAN